MLYFGTTADPKKATLPPEPSFSWNRSGGQWRDLSRWYPVVYPTTAEVEPWDQMGHGESSP